MVNEDAPEDNAALDEDDDEEDDEDEAEEDAEELVLDGECCRKLVRTGGVSSVAWAEIFRSERSKTPNGEEAKLAIIIGSRGKNENRDLT